MPNLEDYYTTKLFDRIHAAIDKLEIRLESTNRRIGNLSAPPLPEPPPHQTPDPRYSQRTRRSYSPQSQSRTRNALCTSGLSSYFSTDTFGPQPYSCSDWDPPGVLSDYYEPPHARSNSSRYSARRTAYRPPGVLSDYYEPSPERSNSSRYSARQNAYRPPRNAINYGVQFVEQEWLLRQPHCTHQSPNSGWFSPESNQQPFLHAKNQTCWDTPSQTSSRRVGKMRASPLPEPQPQPSQHRAAAPPAPAAAPPPLLHMDQQRSPSCCHPTTHLRQAEACLELPTTVQQPLLQRSPSCLHSPSLHSTTKLVSCEEKYLEIEGDSKVSNQVDLRLNVMKLIDEEFCYETEWIPNSHSLSLDHKSDAHQNMNKNYSLNWRGSFLDEVDESKSSLLDDNHDTATFDDDEFTEMECHSVKMSDDSELQVDGHNSSPSCVENSSQQKCLDSYDDYKDDRVVGEGRRSYNLTAAELQQLKVLVQRFMEDKKFGGRRNDDDVRRRCMIRSLLQAPAIKDDFVKTKAREERDDVITLEMLVGVISEMMVILFLIAFDPGGDVSMLLLSSTLSVVPWFPP